MHGTCVPCCILVADDLSATGMHQYTMPVIKKIGWQLQQHLMALDLILSSREGLILVKWLELLPLIRMTDMLTGKTLSATCEL